MYQLLESYPQYWWKISLDVRWMSVFSMWNVLWDQKVRYPCTSWRVRWWWRWRDPDRRHSRWNEKSRANISYTVTYSLNSSCCCISLSICSLVSSTAYLYSNDHNSHFDLKRSWAIFWRTRLKWKKGWPSNLFMVWWFKLPWRMEEWIKRWTRHIYFKRTNYICRHVV